MIVETLQIPSLFDRLISHTARKYHKAAGVRFVYEAGFSGFYLCRKLKEASYLCIITPPNRIPSQRDKVKTDKRDARKLARYFASGLLKSIYIPPASIETDRQIIRLRKDNQKKLSRIKNQIKAFLCLGGHVWTKEMGCCWTKRYVAWLETLELKDDSSRFLLDAYIKEYHFYRDQVAHLTWRIRELSRSEAYQVQFKYLIACRGIGLITAMTFLLELYDMTRFPSAKKFCSYLGLTPAQYTSGEHVRLGHITREGNAHVRGTLVEGAWTVIRYDPFLREKYDRIRARGSNGKKAIVAVARSLAVRLRRCLLDENPYVPGTC